MEKVSHKIHFFLDGPVHNRRTTTSSVFILEETFGHATLSDLSQVGKKGERSWWHWAASVLAETAQKKTKKEETEESGTQPLLFRDDTYLLDTKPG